MELVNVEDVKRIDMTTEIIPMMNINKKSCGCTCHLECIKESEIECRAVCMSCSCDH